MLALSWVAAFVACLGYGVGSVLQSVGAQRVELTSGVSGVARIVRQLPYLAGLAADVLAFGAGVVALQRLPLFLVQSVLTASVGVTAVIAAFRGERLGRRDWLALGVLGAGLVLLSLTAVPGDAVAMPAAVAWVLLASCGAPLLLGLVGTRLRPRPAALVLAAAAGLAWTGLAVASRGLSADAIGWALLASPLVWALVVHGVLGAAFFALALQRGSVTTVTAVTFALELLLPSALGLWLLGDAVGPGQGPVAVLGFLLAAGGTVVLIRSAK
jgi:drug/metabolite transporter (DMT)-like permease